MGFVIYQYIVIKYSQAIILVNQKQKFDVSETVCVFIMRGSCVISHGDRDSLRHQAMICHITWSEKHNQGMMSGNRDCLRHEGYMATESASRTLEFHGFTRLIT